MIPSELKFAIIVPVYNTAKYLRECLDSVLSQTHKNFTLFAVDDGSIDESGKILDAYAIKDSRFKVTHKENEGVSIARNTALKLIESENDYDFIVFLDSDDYLSPTCLETISQTATETNVDMVAFGFNQFDRNGIVVDRRKKNHDPIVISNDESFGLFSFAILKRIPFIRKTLASVLEKSPARSAFVANIAFRTRTVRGLRFNSSLRVSEDQDYRIQGLMRCEKCAVISDCLYNYRLRNGSLSHSEDYIQSDLLLCLSWLKTIKTLPPIGRITLEQKTFDIWWQHLELLSKSNSLEQEWDNCCLYLTEIKKLFISSVLSYPKSLKRLTLFKLGKTITNKYLSYRLSKKRTKPNNFFD